MKSKNYTCQKCGCTNNNRCETEELGECWKVKDRNLCSHCLLEERKTSNQNYSDVIEDSQLWHGEAGL